MMENILEGASKPTAALNCDVSVTKACKWKVLKLQILYLSIYPLFYKL
jgi:hypothetical protein